MRGIVIAGTHSGAGKTTVATGMMAALSRRGVRVQPFKAGPDYIDPSYHTTACGAPSRNLDTWLLEESVIRELFQRAMRGQDLAVVEGVMGLYDGFGGDSEEGSTAHLAKLLDLPVVLVADASGAARSVAATVLGFKAFDPDVRLAGVILNGVASPRHLEFIQPSLDSIGVPVLGCLPRRPDLALPERYLGLVPTPEGVVARDFFDRLSAQIESSIDLPAVLSAARPVSHQTESASGSPKVRSPYPRTGRSPTTIAAQSVFPPAPVAKKTAIAVARDKAFSFYYADSLDLLEAWGAEVVPFSPLDDPAIPPGVGGVYIGGGFPELYAAPLADNASMLESLRTAAARGLPIYAECGGLMYLGESLEDRDGKARRMAGIIPACSTMRDTRLTLGYRTVRALADTPLMKSGEEVRGHEFHLSALATQPAEDRAVYRVLGRESRPEGFRTGNVTASYVHLHFASGAGLAKRFVDACAKATKMVSHEVL